MTEERRSGSRRESDVTLAAIGAQVGEMHGMFQAHLDEHKRAMSWKSPLGIALIMAALGSLGTIVRDQVMSATTRERVAALEMSQAAQDTTDGVVAWATVLGCQYTEFTNRYYSVGHQPIVTLAIGCDSIKTILHRRLDGKMP